MTLAVGDRIVTKIAASRRLRLRVEGSHDSARDDDQMTLAGEQS
jgi:hypothetical protein